jgi:hypothetical protein
VGVAVLCVWANGGEEWRTHDKDAGNESLEANAWVGQNRAGATDRLWHFLLSHRRPEWAECEQVLTGGRTRRTTRSSNLAIVYKSHRISALIIGTIGIKFWGEGNKGMTR